MSSDETIAANAFYGAVACALLAIVVPWIVLRFHRWAAVAIGAALALAGTILESVSNSHIPNNVDIRVDVVIIYPMLLVAWLQCVVLARKTMRAKPVNLP